MSKESKFTRNDCPTEQDLAALPMSHGLVVPSFPGVPDGGTIIRTVGGVIYNFSQSSIFIPLNSTGQKPATRRRPTTSQS